MASSTAHPSAANGNGLHPRQRKGGRRQKSDRAQGDTTPSVSSTLRNSRETLSASETPSGANTPIPENAPPSDQYLFSARKLVRAEQRRLRRRIFPTVDYTSRVSHFDPNSDYRDFHGFYTLFWIGLCVLAITTMLRNIKDTGYPMRVRIWALFTVKLQQLAFADFMMVATTAASLPMQQLSRKFPANSIGTWKSGGRAVQSLYQVAWLAFWVAVPFVFNWTWTAQVFFLLHTMTMLMKMHSYAFYNGHLSETEKRLRALDNPSTASKAPVYLYPSPENPEGTLSSPKRSSFSQREKLATVNGNNHADSDIDRAWGSDEELENLREDLARELTSPMGNVTYPRNLTWWNFLDYLLCPTLCYELEYPRMPNIDWTALSSKIVATFVCIFLLTIVSEEFILPVLTDASARLHPVSPLTPTLSISESLLVLAETISWLLFPFMVTFLLVFLVIFEYILGAFAEITRFADRHFYSDWWNSTDWMEFSREWNMPVHAFLRRHVYSASRARMGRTMATAMTFLISAMGHEIVMACITKKLRGYGFICQMLQLPIVVLQKTKWVRDRHTLNNAMFWCSMILGLSLICSLYVLI